jgi:hypothetical protein
MTCHHLHLCRVLAAENALLQRQLEILDQQATRERSLRLLLEDRPQLPPALLAELGLPPETAPAAALAQAAAALQAQRQQIQALQGQLGASDSASGSSGSRSSSFYSSYPARQPEHELEGFVVRNQLRGLEPVRFLKVLCDFLEGEEVVECVSVAIASLSALSEAILAQFPRLRDRPLVHRLQASQALLRKL